MNETEARELLNAMVLRYRDQPYDFWERWISSRGEALTSVETGESGAEYQVEVQAFVEDRKSGDIRVLFAIDDGGLRAFLPLTDSFIIARDGSFIGE